MYKFFDATFWKYSFYVEWQINRLFLIPMFSVELKIVNNCPCISVDIGIWRYFVSVTYCDGNIPEYEIIENTFQKTK
jgi:hypothetical protein